MTPIIMSSLEPVTVTEGEEGRINIQCCDEVHIMKIKSDVDVLTLYVALSHVLVFVRGDGVGRDVGGRRRSV